MIDIIEKRVKKVMTTILGIAAEAINDNTSPDTIATWNSHAQMNLIIALEDEFNVHFDDNQIVEMMNYKLIICTMKEMVI